MPKGLKITTDKHVEEVTIDAAGEFIGDEATRSSLKQYQAIVGGYIEAVPLFRTGGDIIINEEGKILGLPFNSIATDLALSNQSIMLTDAIVGDVIVMGPVDDEGDMTDVTARTRRLIRLIAREAR